MLASIKAHLRHQHSPFFKVKADETSKAVTSAIRFPESGISIATELIEYPEIQIILLVSMELHKYELKWPSILAYKVLDTLGKNYTDSSLVLQYIKDEHLAIHASSYPYLISDKIVDYNELSYKEVSIYLERHKNNKNLNSYLKDCLNDISMSRFRTIIEHSSLALRKKLGAGEKAIINRKYAKGLWLEQNILLDHDKYKSYKKYILPLLQENILESDIDLKGSEYKVLENIIGGSSTIKNKRKLYNVLRLLRPRELMALLGTGENDILNFLKNSHQSQYWYSCLMESACLHEDQEFIELFLVCIIHHPILKIANHLQGILRDQINYTFYQKFTSLSLQNSGFERTLINCEKLLEIRYFSWSKKTSDRILGYIQDDPFFLQNDMMEVQKDNLRQLVLHMHSSSLKALGEKLTRDYSFSEEKLSYWKSMLYLRIKLRNELRKWQKKTSNT